MCTGEPVGLAHERAQAPLKLHKRKPDKLEHTVQSGQDIVVVFENEMLHDLKCMVPQAFYFHGHKGHRNLR